MLPLDEAVWSNLSPREHARLYPARLRKLAEAVAAGTYTRRCLGELATMCDQWSTYDSTLAAVPHLVGICREQPPASAARIDLLAWVGWCVACIDLNHQDCPGQLRRWYDHSVPVARDLIAESLPFTPPADGERDLARELLAAFAACHGRPALAFILYELEAGGFRCDHCRSPIRPMQSSMNPLRGPSDSS
jgi:hypothetical protein